MHTGHLLFPSLGVPRKTLVVLTGILIIRANLALVGTVLLVYTLQDYFPLGRKPFFFFFLNALYLYLFQ